ncbi:hypothetical protein C8J56DRAFT_1051644 [Mycena floridula]|nr:hypothetical protein C8J56DRAFT_1051644 [Mycena floridula]
MTKCVQRSKASLTNLHNRYRALAVWNPTKEGIYMADARKLARDLIQAGCAAGKTFGISVNRDISQRTVSRAIDEGGKYGEIQLVQEILDAPGLIESSDRTTHRGHRGQSAVQ